MKKTFFLKVCFAVMACFMSVMAFAGETTLASEIGGADAYSIIFNDSVGLTSGDVSIDIFSQNESARMGQLIRTGDEHISAIEGTKVYRARQGAGIKFGTSSIAGTLTLTLAEAAEFDSIVMVAAMYGGSEGGDGFTANGVTFPLSAGNKIFEHCVLTPEGVVSELAIVQNKASKGRFYLKEIIFYAKQSGETPVDPQPVVEYYLAGNGAEGAAWCDGKNWTVDGTPLVNNTITYTALPAGVYQFKVTNGTWDAQWGYSNLADNTNIEDGGGNNVKFILCEPCDVTIAVNPEADQISLTIVGTYGNCPIEITSMTIVGDPRMIPWAWEPSSVEGDMTKLADGSYTLTLTNVALEAGQSYQYKAAANHAWGVKELPASGDNILTVEADGNYDIVFTVNAELTELNAVATLAQVVPITSMTIVGQPDLLAWGWTPTAMEGDMTLLEDGSYIFTLNNITLTAGNYNYKATANHKWYHELPGAGEYSNAILTIEVDGTYDIVFTVNAEMTEVNAVATLIEATPAEKPYPDNQVKVVYSDIYGFDCDFGEWGSGTQCAQELGAKHFTTTALGYFGLTFESRRLNCSAMEALHAEFYTNVDMSLRIVPIHGGTEVGVTVNITAGAWNEINIPLTEFEGVTDWTDVYQIKIDNAANADFKIREVYFYTTQLPTEDTAAPTYLEAQLANVSYFSANINAFALDNSGVVIFRVYDGDTLLIEKPAVSGNVATITLYNLAVGTTYNFTVVAADEAGNVCEGVSVEVATLAAPASATDPTYNAADVLAVYSSIYPEITWSYQNWWEGADITEGYLSDGQKVLCFTPTGEEGGCFGMAFAATDVTAYKQLEMDVYPTADAVLNAQVIGIGEPSAITLVANQWNHVVIDIAGNTKTDCEQIGLYNNQNMGGAFFVQNVMFVKETEATGEITYELNGGITNDYGWLTPDDMFDAFMADAGATNYQSLSYYVSIKEAGGDALGAPNICARLTNAAPALRMEKWAWLKAYIESVHAAQADAGASALAADGTGTAWRYAVGAFFIDGQRDSWPISANFATCGVNSELTKKAWQHAFCNPTEITEEFVLNTPYHPTSTFEGWYDNAEFNGDPITVVNTETPNGTLYAKWANPERILTVAEARDVPVDQTLNVAGIVTLVNGNQFFIQDETAGMLGYGAKVDLNGNTVYFSEGDRVVLQATVTLYNNQHELTNIQVVSQEAGVNVVPQHVSIPEMYTNDDILYKLVETRAVAYNYGTYMMLIDENGQGIYTNRGFSTVTNGDTVLISGAVFYGVNEKMFACGPTNLLEVHSPMRYQVSGTATNGYVTGDGSYIAGTEIWLTATPNMGYRFTQWNDGNTDNPRMVIVGTEDAVYEAEFALWMPADATIAINVTCTTDSAHITYYPSDTTATYIHGCVIKERFEAEYGNRSDEEFLLNILDEIQEQIDFYAQYGYTITVGNFLWNGITTYDKTELTENTDYVIWAAYLSEDGEIMKVEVFKQEFRTKGYFTANFVVDNELVATETVMSGDSIVAPEVSREGYTLVWDNWTTIMPANDIYVIGHYEVNSYVLTYIADGVVVTADSIAYGAAITAPEAPAKEGYTFNGWGEIPATMPANDVTIESSYSINSYTLIFKIGEEFVDTTLVEFGAAITAPEAPAKEGYTFNGWGEIPATMPANDVTIEGTYSINSYTLIFKIGEEFADTTLVEFGAAITAPEAPAKEGYTFNGWGEVPTTMPANDVTIEGTYTINQYTVTIVAENGTVEGAGVYDWGTEITLTATAAEGYEFKGWSDENTENPRTIVVTADIELTAIFEQLPPVEEGVEDAVKGSLQVINHTIVATEAIRIYTVTGQDVTTMNGNLVNGIYVVVGKTINTKVRI